MTKTYVSFRKSRASKQPLKPRDRVVGTMTGCLIEEGKSYIVISCAADDDYESGWKVTVAKAKRGRPPKELAIFAHDYDSGWFKKA